MTIGQLAGRANVGVETIRFYERRGLIEQPVKPVSGYRRYGSDCLRRLLFIRRARSLGFGLEDIRNLLLLSDGRCVEVQALAGQKLDKIRSKIEDLRRLQAPLEALLERCGDNPDETRCPIIDTLLAGD